uniref:Uncharacterized protein n=1 Tax=Glossina austeni TaxID=7395 RepID=A0A1A9V2V8_GLOAU
MFIMTDMAERAQKDSESPYLQMRNYVFNDDDEIKNPRLYNLWLKNKPVFYGNCEWIHLEDLLFTRSSDLSRDRELEQLILGEDVLPLYLRVAADDERFVLERDTEEAAGNEFESRQLLTAHNAFADSLLLVNVGIAVSSNSVIAITVMASVDITVITFFFGSNNDDNFAVGIVRLVNAFHKRNGVTPPLMYVLATFRRPLIEEKIKLIF